MKRAFTILQRIFIFLLLTKNVVSAQDSSSLKGKDYANFPVWIQMMDDPNTNYYEAIKASDEYWKNHLKPVMEEEEEMDGKSDFREMKRELKKEMKNDQSVVLTDQQWKEKNDAETMKYNIKRFERWKRDVLPFVQEDGRILTDEERKNIWLKEQEELKKTK